MTTEQTDLEVKECGSLRTPTDFRRAYQQALKYANAAAEYARHAPHDRDRRAWLQTKKDRELDAARYERALKDIGETPGQSSGKSEYHD